MKTIDGPRDWPTIHLDVGPSRTLSILLALPYGLGILSIACLPGAWSPRVAAIAGLVWLAVRAVREHGSRTADGSIRRLEWLPDGRWWLDLVGQGGCEARLAPRGFVHRGLVVIGLDVGDGRRPRILILAAGNTASDDLRRLRVRLLLARGGPESLPASRRHR